MRKLRDCCDAFLGAFCPFFLRHCSEQTQILPIDGHVSAPCLEITDRAVHIQRDLPRRFRPTILGDCFSDLPRSLQQIDGLYGFDAFPISKDDFTGQWYLSSCCLSACEGAEGDKQMVGLSHLLVSQMEDGDILVAMYPSLSPITCFDRRRACTVKCSFRVDESSGLLSTGAVR